MEFIKDSLSSMSPNCSLSFDAVVRSSVLKSPTTSCLQDAGEGLVMKTDGKHMYGHVTAPVALG